MASRFRRRGFPRRRATRRPNSSSSFAAIGREFAPTSRGLQPNAPPSTGRRSLPTRRTASRPTRNVTSNTTNGPSMSGWRSQYDAFSTWHQMPPFIIGWADTSGSYAAWIATGPRRPRCRQQRTSSWRRRTCGSRRATTERRSRPISRFSQCEVRRCELGAARRDSLQALLREPPGRQRPVYRSGLGVLAVRLRALPRLGATRATPAAAATAPRRSS